jgi:uncharacterized damage-inducible protein DinB
MPINPITRLLDDYHWANRQSLGVCRALSEEQFHKRFEIGLGTLHDTLTHILSDMRGWTEGQRSRRRPLNQQSN